jgi:hypothetical protein
VLAARWIGLPAFAGRHFAIYPARFSIFGHEKDYPERPVISLWNAETIAPLLAVEAVGRGAAAGSAAPPKHRARVPVDETASPVAADR